MSVEFRNEGFPGWFQDDPNKQTILRANITELTNKNGGKDPIVAEFNYGDGSIQYYTVKEGIGFNGTRVPLFTQSASGARTVQNQAILNNLKPEDVARVEASVKSTSFRANQTLATDAEKETLKNSAYYKSQGNTAPTPEPSVSEGGTQPKPITQENINTLVQQGIEGKPPRTNYGNLFYPKDIGSTQSDLIKFTMFKYGTRPLSTRTVGFGERNLEQITGSVIMSVQPSIGDFNSINWNPSEMSPLAQVGTSAALEFIDTGSVEGVKKLIENTLGSENENLKKAIIATIAQEASGAKGLLTRLTGAMFNNNLELLFMGPQLRQFTFNFKMSPRYKEEADDVRKIIRFFKQGSAVQRSTTNLFLKSPNVFKIEYKNRGPNGEDHKSLNRIKTCALVNVGVDYTPSGSYMTYEEDGSMVSYNLSLTFNELEPVYEDEYGDLDGKINDSAGIGY